jgi:putative MATE family efflux protein
LSHDDDLHPEDRLTQTSSSISPDDPPLASIALEKSEALPDSEGVIRSGKLAGKSMWAAIWILALPVLVQQLMIAGVGMFDKIIAGSLPGAIVVPALDGLGIASYIGWFIGIAMTGLGIGGQAIIARAMGGGNLSECDHALGQTISVGLIWSVLVGVMLWFLASPLAAFCSLTPEASLYCVQYIRTIACSMPVYGLMLVGAMCLHGAGETTKPSIISVQVNLLNIVLSWIFSGADLRFGSTVFENPFDFDLHVLGIALGTALSYGWGGVMTLKVLMKGVHDLKLHGAQMPPERSMIKRIVWVGVPNFFEGISMWAVNIFVLMIIGLIAASQSNGEGLQGAHIIAVQWESFSFLPGFAIGTAGGALAGQYLGAGNARLAQKSVIACSIIGMTIMGLLGLVFMFFGQTLTSIVSEEAIHLENTPKLLFIGGSLQIFFALTMVIRQGLRGVGDTRWTFIITTVSSYAVRLPGAYLLGVTYELGLVGVWYALCGEFVVRSILFSARFFHGGWKHIKV